MAETKRKGDIGEAKILAEALNRGYKVALPVGEDWRYDLIVLRKGKLERVQCKYVESDGDVVTIPCRSSNNWSTLKYTPDELDWIAVFDRTTDKCYFVPSSLLGEHGRATISLRLNVSKNGQLKGILWAKDFEAW